MDQVTKFLRQPLPYRQYNIVFIIIVANVLMFFLTSIAPSLLSYLAMNILAVQQRFFIWQLFSYMFVHGNTAHLFFNMLGLYFFGVQVEKELGSWEFLVFYLVCGTLAGIGSLFIYWLFGMHFVFLLGASGALFSVLLAFATIHPRARIFVFGILPITASTLVVVYTVMELLFQLNAGRSSNVAHLTHLSGFFFAFLYFVLRFGINPIRRLLQK